VAVASAGPYTYVYFTMKVVRKKQNKYKIQYKVVQKRKPTETVKGLQLHKTTKSFSIIRKST